MDVHINMRASCAYVSV